MAESLTINNKEYTIIKKLGKGTYGKVFLVEDKKEKKQYAIKKILLENYNENNKKYIETEIENFSKIGKNDNTDNDNNNIVKYYKSYNDNENFYIFMEYCEGQSLREFINEKKNKNELIEEEIIYGYILDICLGIKTIHDKNIIHRDLKPENLFLTKDKKNIKIGDFGIARQLDNQKQLVSSKIGTPEYAAEVHEKKTKNIILKQIYGPLDALFMNCSL